jgi:hypothetical protein
MGDFGTNGNVSLSYRYDTGYFSLMYPSICECRGDYIGILIGWIPATYKQVPYFVA